MDTAVIFFASYLPYLVIVFLAVWWSLGKDRLNKAQTVFFAFLSAAISWIIASLIKYNFASPRPIGGLDSFPSAHAAFFGALALAVYLRSKKFGTFLFVCALLIGWARVSAGFHWPIDILAGFLIGAAVAWGIYKIANFKF